MNFNLAGGRVAVTGATGFIGRHLVERLVSASVDVRALCRRNDANLTALGVDVVKGSLEHKASLSRVVDGVDTVVHCAGNIHATTSKEFDRANRGGTARLAQVCAAQPLPPRFILMSTVAARSPEISAYAASKRGAELALAEHADNMHWSIVRPPAVYGPRDTATLRLFKLIRGGLLPVPSRHGNRLSLIFVSDLCEAVMSLISSSAGDSRTFEIRDECEAGYSWLDIAKAGGRVFGRHVTCVPVPRVVMSVVALANQAICGIMRSTPTITRGKVREIFHKDWVCRENDLTRCTNWRPNVSIYGGFERSINWYLENNLLQS